MRVPKYTKLALLMLLFVALFASILVTLTFSKPKKEAYAAKSTPASYWLLLHRKSNKEFLYKGVPGEPSESTLVKTFVVKSGVPGEKPTPLPKLLGREYWLITKKMDSSDNPETAPYFLELDVPVTDEEPYGPEQYLECEGQCNWELPGTFGLHGVNGDLTRLSAENVGSSGCIRHTDEDITYLYNLLQPEKEPVRYYVEDV